MSQGSDESSHTLEAFGDLSLSTPRCSPLSENLVVPEELNNYLRDHLAHMKDENTSLRKELSSRNSQMEQKELNIQKLHEKLKDYEIISGNTEYTSASQLASIKIVELCKKLREKQSEIEVYKTKCSKLENTLSDVEKDIARNKDRGTEKTVQESIINKESVEIKKLEDKLMNITNKWTEEKNQNLQLKTDLKKAKKWLQQEVGDKFETLLCFNNSSSNWRGRAQIICDLQKKNRELKDKLKSYQEANKDQVLNDLNNSKCDKNIDKLNSEKMAIKKSFDDLKQKYDVVKTRCKVLETEYGVLKTKTLSLSQKLEEDQKTIKKLMSQISHFNEMKNEDLKQKDQIIKNLQQTNDSLKEELAKEKCLSENKSKKLLEKNDDIELLNRTERPTSSFIHKSDNDESRTVSRLQAERLRLLELTEIQSKRLEDERNAHMKTQQVLRAERKKGAKLEANFARLQLERDNTRSGYSSRVNNSKEITSNIHDKLELAEENVKALSTRLEMEMRERKYDFLQFSKILQNYDCT